jgi:hypothetical protein
MRYILLGDFAALSALINSLVVNEYTCVQLTISEYMFASCARYFSKGRVTAGVAHDKTEFSKIVPKGAKADAIYRRYVVKFARINGIMKDQYFTTRYREKDVWRRNRLLGESAYFKKWHYMKYCCQLIKHAVKNKLTFGVPFDPSDECRLPVPAATEGADLAKPDGYSLAELERMQQEFHR